MAGIAASASAESFSADQIEFFEKNIRPVLAEKCYSCHGAKKHQNGLRVDQREALMKGSEYGAVVDPRNPAASKLIRAIKHAPGLEPMPKKGDALKPEQIAMLEKWIGMGLPWPEEKATVAHAEKADWTTALGFSAGEETSAGRIQVLQDAGSAVPSMRWWARS